MGFKQNMLAERLDLSNNYLSSIERGKKTKFGSHCKYLQCASGHAGLFADGLRLCTKEDLSLLSVLIDHLVERQSQKWNNDNFA